MSEFKIKTKTKTMKTKELIENHFQAIEILTKLEHYQKSLDETNRKINLKETTPDDSEVLFWNLSELEIYRNKYKDAIHNLEIQYKKLMHYENK